MKEPTTIDGLVRRAVERRPDQPALADAPNRETVDGNAPQRLTWAGLDGRIDGAAAALAAHGIGPGDPVGIQLANVVELPITVLACFRLGAVAVESKGLSSKACTEYPEWCYILEIGLNDVVDY